MDSDAIFMGSDLKSLAWGRYKKSTLGLENRKKAVTCRVIGGGGEADMEEHGPGLKERVESGRERQKPKGTDNSKPRKGHQGAGRTGVKGPAGKKRGQRGRHPGPAKRPAVPRTESSNTQFSL